LEVRSQMAELPRVMAQRFVRDYGLPEYDATLLTQSKTMAAYFEDAARMSGQAKTVSNWIMGEISRRLNADAIGIEKAPVQPSQLAAMIARIVDGTISNSAARQVFEELWSHPGPDVDAIIEAKSLRQMSDSSALETIVDSVLASNTKNIEEFRAGKDKAFNALVGQIMKASKGKANPQQVNDLLRAKLAS